MLPGGKIDLGEQEVDCLEREVQEELQCQVHRATLRSLGEFTDVAANEPDTLVSMKLTQVNLSGQFVLLVRLKSFIGSIFRNRKMSLSLP